jgi:WD40 repeat protein
MATANPEKLKSAKQHNLKFIAMAVARQPKTGRLFLGGSDFKVYALDPASAKGEVKEIGKHESYVTGLAVAGEHLVSGGYDGRLSWWDIEKATAIRSLEAHTKWIRNVIVSPDGKLVASVADDMVCKVHEADTGKLVHELRGHKEKTPTHFRSMLYACTFSADGKRLATGDKVGHIVVWDVASGKPMTTLESPGMYTWDGRQRIHSIGGIRGLSFSPDGKQMAVGGIGLIGNIDHLDGPARVEVLEIESGKRTHLFEKTKFKGLINRLAFHPQGDWLLGAGGAGTGFFVFYDLKKNKVVKEEAVKYHVHAIAWNEDMDTLYAAGHNALGVYEMKG